MITIFSKVFKNKLLIICTFLSSIIYIAWRIFFTLPFGYGFISMIAGIILLSVELIGLFESVIHYRTMFSMEYPERPQIDRDLYPEIDVFVTTYNEPVELIYKTINGCVNMDYPDKKKVHIFICDDSNRDEMKELADKLKVNYVTRTERKGAKAGNLNNAMQNSSSPLIVTFDADMIPMHDFLMACVPYFLEKEQFIKDNPQAEVDEEKFEQIGFVQTPQSFYNPDLFQYNLFSENRIPNEQDYFYRDIQVSRNKTNSVIYGGSNTILSRKALEEVGGFYTKVITEDFATGMLIQSKGYRCYAIDEIHASGLSPSDLQSLIKQRERWARGCIQTGRKLNILFRKGLNFGQKLSYLSAISYWYSGFKRLVYIISPILLPLFGIMVLNASLLEILIFWLPMHLLNSASLKLLSKNIRNTKWTNVYETILFPSLLPVVFLETLGISKKKFSVTRKEGPVFDKRYQIKKAIPHTIFAAFSIAAIVKCIVMTFEVGSPVYSVLLFWLIMNLYTILMSIFFMLGREYYRSVERFPIKTQCLISFEEILIHCSTVDISEGGIAVIIKEPRFIPYDEAVKCEVSTVRYKAEFRAVIVQVTELSNGWRYAFKINSIEELDYRQLLNIIHDREPALPKYLEKNSSIFEDLRINLLKRKNKQTRLSRKLPRINLNKRVQVEEAGTITMINFNYEYILIKNKKSMLDRKKIKIHLNEEVTIDATLIKHNVRGKKELNEGKAEREILLYRVDNYKQVAQNPKLLELLKLWIKQYESAEIAAIERSKRSKGRGIAEDEFDEMKYL